MRTIDGQMDASPNRSLLSRLKSYALSLPIVTVFLAGIAVAFQFCPGLGERMCFDRTAIAAGQHWRLLTGHFTHCSSDHLIWDVLMFALLGATIERRDRGCLAATLVTSAAVISLALWSGQTGVEHYRGLSGIDSALFMLALLLMLDDARRAKQTIVAWTLVAMAAGFVAKVLWELATGSTLFVDSSRAGFVPLPLVHAVGGLTGVIVWLADRRLVTNCSSTVMHRLRRKLLFTRLVSEHILTRQLTRTQERGRP